MAIFQRTLTAAVAAAALTGVFTASAWAQAEPQLPAAPVTAATFPFSSIAISMFSFSVRWSWLEIASHQV